MKTKYGHLKGTVADYCIAKLWEAAFSRVHALRSFVQNPFVLQCRNRFFWTKSRNALKIDKLINFRKKYWQKLFHIWLSKPLKILHWIWARSKRLFFHTHLTKFVTNLPLRNQKLRADDVAHLLHLLFHCTVIENHVIGAVPAVNLRVISRRKAGAGPGWEAEGLGDLPGGQQQSPGPLPKITKWKWHHPQPIGGPRGYSWMEAIFHLSNKTWHTMC